VEGDWSNAAFWLCAGALSADPAGVEVTGLDLASTQGDRAVLDVLRAMGAAVAEKPEAGAARVAAGDLADVTIDAHDVPDLVPVLAVTAAAARGTTRVVNAARLRIKESDRLATTAELLRALGVQVEELPDGLVIEGLAGAPFSACTVSAHGDHRIAMAAAVAATRADGPVTVDGAQAVAKSYPAFFADLLDLGGAVLLNAGAAAGPGAPRE
jgi:3-phosphoshikimate 1-carboxyvinyltransferase